MKARKPKMVKGMQFKGGKVKETPMRPGKPDGTKGKRKATADMAMLQERMPR